MGQRPYFVIQSDGKVTVPYDESAVVCIPNDDEISIFVTMAVNFLRSGCPCVEIIGEWGWRDKIRDLISTLQLPGERFDVASESNGQGHSAVFIYKWSRNTAGG